MDKKNQEKLKENIVRVKKLIAVMVRKENVDLTIPLEKLNKEICLVVAEFRCQNPKCKNEDELVLHHLIKREDRKFMDLWRYLSQRHYWANQIILCRYCEDKIHNRISNLKKRGIKAETIRGIKLKYGYDVK